MVGASAGKDDARNVVYAYTIRSLTQPLYLPLAVYLLTVVLTLNEEIPPMLSRLVILTSTAIALLGTKMVLEFPFRPNASSATTVGLACT